MRPLGLFATVACALVVASCGDDGDSTAADAAGLDAEPARLVQRMVTEAMAAKKVEDCTFVARVNRRSPSKILCPPPDKGIRRALGTIELTDAAVFGTGAVVDYESKAARDGATIVLNRDGRGSWSLIQFGLVAKDRPDDPDSAARNVVDEFVDAVRDRDCERYFKVAATQSADVRVACREEFPATRALGARLRADPDARIDHLGGDGGVDFYALRTAAPRRAYYTISTTTTPEGSLRPHVVLRAQRGPVAP